MTEASTDRLDRAIVVGCRTVGYTGVDETVREEHRTFARALIADLLEGLEDRLNQDMRNCREHGFKRGAQEAGAQLSLLAEIKDRAGIGGE